MACVRWEPVLLQNSVPRTLPAITILRRLFFASLLLFFFTLQGQSQYQLRVVPVDKDSASFASIMKVPKSFRNAQACSVFVAKIQTTLFEKGYAGASIDQVTFDSTFATVHVYTGEQQRWIELKMDSIDPSILSAVGWQQRNKQYRLSDINSVKEKIIDHLENSGYPFAQVTVDSIELTNEGLKGRMLLSRGPRYKIDSIRNQGTANLSNNYLQHYLGIRNNSIYKKDRLVAISKRITELPFVQEQQQWDMTYLGTGSILNLYLAPKKSSQVNVLVGFLPSNDQLVNNKLLVTGEALVNLKNALGNGESIGLNWQQIQVRSPRLNLSFQQPYLFNTSFGVNFGFDLFKKDSSFVNISLLAGIDYAASANQTATVFVQNLRTNLLTVDTFRVKSTRRLPQEADVSSINVGINYEFFNTDYRFNPRRGNEVSISTSAGTKTLRKNNVIVKLSDNADPSFDFGTLYDTFQLKSYQMRIRLKAVHYFPLSRASTFRTAFTGGWFQSPNIFRNELFQIGGYKLLRGFDEESIFASAYGVVSGEYRYLLGRNSFLFGFVDFGIVNNKGIENAVTNNYLGVGLGMAFETQAGIFNISYAAGKRDDSKFNLRQSKIHLGYVNYF
jgi:outer membrane protein assembly factor BamA